MLGFPGPEPWLNLLLVHASPSLLTHSLLLPASSHSLPSNILSHLLSTPLIHFVLHTLSQLTYGIGQTLLGGDNTSPSFLAILPLQMVPVPWLWEGENKHLLPLPTPVVKGGRLFLLTPGGFWETPFGYHVTCGSLKVHSENLGRNPTSPQASRAPSSIPVLHL